MDPATAALAISVGSRVLGGISGSRARKKARKKRRKMIEAALRELDPKQIADLASRLGVGGMATAASMAPAQIEELAAQGRRTGVDPGAAIAAFSGQTRNTAALSGFENAMGLSNLRANATLSQVGQIQPNYNVANTLGTVGDLVDTYSLYKGYLPRSGG